MAIAMIDKPAVAVEANGQVDLQKRFSRWIEKRVELEKEQHGFHRGAHKKKLNEKRGMNIPDGRYTSDELTFDDLFQAPDDPKLWPLWRDWLAQWRKDKRKALAYDDSYYSDKAFAWVPSNYVSGFLMLWDMTLCDPVEGRYRVEAFIENGKKEFGGYDSVVLWLAYPILGIGQRNQTDMYRDMPGGLQGVRDLVEAFHQHGIEVFMPFQPWDKGTRKEDKTDAEVLLSVTEATNADGIYLDTWYECAPLRLELDKIRPGLAIDTELPIPIEHVAEHQMSWAQSKPWREWLFEDSQAPGVLKSKWLERRHVVRPTNRWITERTGELQVSWMNGTGTLIWENRFGCWNGWSEQARSILRSMIPIQRRYVNLFAGEAWTPLVAHRGETVFAGLWQGEGLRLWTLVNRADEPYRGNLLAVQHQQDTQYFDLIKGKQAKVKLEEGVAHIDGEIDARGIGGFLAAPEQAVTRGFRQFLKTQARIHKRRNWDPTFPEGKRQVLHPVSRTKAYEKDRLPSNMAAISATTVELQRSFNEGAFPQGFHDKLPEEQQVKLSAYAIDLTPVTNAEFETFLKASGYQPRQKKNFLMHWVNGRPPVGKEDHPVVYVDLVDARAYAKWAGKRLPTDAEWQYAAAGPKGLEYPWGDEMKSDRCNQGDDTTSVRAFPQGRSPFGCYDMCGNTWEWTESEQTDDGRTRYCLIRGGSYYKTGGSDWYVDGGAQPCDRATKMILVWPGLDRCSTIGFRCVVDWNRGGKELAQKPVQDHEDGDEPVHTEPEIPAWPQNPPDSWLTYHLAHPGPGVGFPGDPNPAYYYQGRYHLHYIYKNDTGFVYAHVSSTDMVQWKWHPTVLTPDFTGHGMFSGTGFFTKAGRPAMVYLGYEKEAPLRIWLMYALDDDLDKWTRPEMIIPKDEAGQEVEFEYHDPDLWLMGDTYYAMSGGDTLQHIMKSKNLKNWQYIGPFFNEDYPEHQLGVSRTEDLQCVNTFKIGNKWMVLGISHPMGCRYYLGDFKDEQYLPDFHGHMNWTEDGPRQGYFAPESLLTRDGRRVVWAWIRGMPLSPKGVQALPRELELPADGVLRIRPLRELETLRYDRKQKKNLTVRRNSAYPLKGLTGNALELQMTFSAPVPGKFGLHLLGDAEDGKGGTSIIAGADKRVLTVGNLHATFQIRPDEDLCLRIFIDKNLVEVFANDRQAVSYVHKQDIHRSPNISLFAKGSDLKVKQVSVWKMKSIWE